MAGTSDAKYIKALTGVVAGFFSITIMLIGFIGYQIDHRIASLETAFEVRTREYDRNIVELQLIQQGHVNDIQNLIGMIQDLNDKP
jgi:hypothetical protein